MTPMAIAGQKYGSAGGCTLAGMRVGLRPPQANDVGLIEEWKLNPESIVVGSPFAGLPKCSEEVMRHLLEAQTDAVIFVIEDLTTQAVHGAVMLKGINWHHRHAEMHAFTRAQFRHDLDAWADAVELLCLFGFRQLELRSITAHLPLEQEGMIKALARNGFEELAVLRRAAFLTDGWRDIVQLRLAQVGDTP